MLKFSCGKFLAGRLQHWLDGQTNSTLDSLRIDDGFWSGNGEMHNPPPGRVTLISAIWKDSLVQCGTMGPPMVWLTNGRPIQRGTEGLANSPGISALQMSTAGARVSGNPRMVANCCACKSRAAAASKSDAIFIRLMRMEWTGKPRHGQSPKGKRVARVHQQDERRWTTARVACFIILNS